MSLVIKDEIRILLGGRDITGEYDGAIVRSLGSMVNLSQFLRRVAVLEALEITGVTIMNPLFPLLISRNKLHSLLKLKAAGIKVPETFSSESLREAYNRAVSYKTSVIKPIIGSRGYGITLAPDPDVAFVVLKALMVNRQPPLIQRYFRSRDYDVRVFVVGEKVVGAMKRIAVGSWKTNIAQGGRGEKLVPDPDLEALALKATKVLGLWYAGVDIVEREGEYYVLEVNASPDWQELERVTEVNPAYEILRLL